MLTESGITPYPALNQLSLQYSIFGFLLRNITKPGNHFAARCYLSALDDTNSLPPGQIFSLLPVLDFWYSTVKNGLVEEGGVRGDAKRPHPPERLYVPVTRKVSLTGETFCSF